MRHNRTINHLGRTASHRSAMLANMASSLIIHKRIATTVAKAKALRGYVEPLLTKSKTDSVHSRRTVFSYLGNKDAAKELFREVSMKIADRPGGYTRILKTGTRLGDQAEMCIIELVDYNEVMTGEKEAKAAKKGRSRRGSGKKAEIKEEKPAAKATKATPKEEVVEEAPEVTDEVKPEKTEKEETEGTEEKE
jgi:large subunit ribosomal protein L17